MHRALARTGREPVAHTLPRPEPALLPAPVRPQLRELAGGCAGGAGRRAQGLRPLKALGLGAPRLSEETASPHYSPMASSTKPDLEDVRVAIGQFLASSRSPALIEPGEEPLPLSADGFDIALAGGRLVLHAWDTERSLRRRIIAIESEKAGRLELVFEKFGKKTGVLALVDTARPSVHATSVKGHRHVFREQMRRFLSRQFCGWKIAELSAEPNLEHSLSPTFPRALVRQGATGWAAIGAPPDSIDPASCLTYGLIWLDYLRRRETRLTIGGLAVFVPHGRHLTTALRMRMLNPEVARYSLFLYSEDGHEHPADPADCGNLDTVLPICRRPPFNDHPLGLAVSRFPDVESVALNDGSVGFRVRGLPFASLSEGRLTFGLERKRVASPSNLAEIEALAGELARMRSPDSRDRLNPLYRKCPEAWLESEVRRAPLAIDARLVPEPLYGQVPAFAGGERNVIDLLAVDQTGRLVVMELKAMEDPHLPLQALDYWMRVDWHARRGEFSDRGYFPGIALRHEAPKLLLVSPALRFHPTAAALGAFLSPQIDMERIGLSIEWQRRLKVVFRASGATSPVWNSGQDN